jgi:hypothetical protein
MILPLLKGFFWVAIGGMDYPAKTAMIRRSGKMSKEMERVKKKKSLDYRGFGGKVGQEKYSRYHIEAGIKAFSQVSCLLGLSR